MKRKATKRELFLALAKPNKQGFSRKVFVSEFVGKYKALVLGNGRSWCRKESRLAKQFKILLSRAKKGRKVVAIKLDGFNTKQTLNQTIRKDLKEKVKKKRCRILFTSKPEVDHKNGRKDDLRLNELSLQREDDFQPLSKAANTAKRQHCKTCKNTGKRFDAKNLGYKKSVFKGSLKYQGTCEGCYWHDPFTFNRKLS